jgi:heat shock protein HslJ
MKMSGNAGCNRMFSEYNISESMISFGMIGTTMMYCEDKMDIETELLNILNEGYLRIEYSNDLMNMYSENKSVLTWKKN